MIVDCEDGGSVITAVCVNDELIPTDVTCVGNGEYTGSGSVFGGTGSGISFPPIQNIPLISGVTAADGSVDKNKLFTYLAVTVLVIGAGVFIYVKQFRKPKGKRRKRK